MIIYLLAFMIALEEVEPTINVKKIVNYSTIYHESGITYAPTIWYVEEKK